MDRRATVTTNTNRAHEPVALGLLHVPAGTPAVDRYWMRALVIRHARDRRLRLVDVLELDEGTRHHGAVLARLAALTAETDAAALLTHGLDPVLAGRLAADLGVRHLPVSDARRPHSPR